MKMSAYKQYIQQGFTLLELLVVLVLLGLISTMATQVFIKEDNQKRFKITLETIDEVKKAVLGTTNNSYMKTQSLGGYASDMGSFPDLMDMSATPPTPYSINNAGDGQPLGLWTTNIHGDGSDELPQWQHMKLAYSTVQDAIAPLTYRYRCIRYHTASAATNPNGGAQAAEYWIREEGTSINPFTPGTVYYPGTKFWAGWRGPYLDRPIDDYVIDGWGTPLKFILGDLVYDGTKTYRCILSHATTAGEDPSTATTLWEEVYVESPVIVDFDDSGVTYSADTFNIVSLGADGIPGGSDYDEDIVHPISSNQIRSAVAGKVVDNATNMPLTAGTNPYVYLHFVHDGEDAWCRAQVNDDGYFLFEQGAQMTSSNNASPTTLVDPATHEMLNDVGAGLAHLFVWYDSNTANCIDVSDNQASETILLKHGGNWLGTIRVQ